MRRLIDALADALLIAVPAAVLLLLPSILAAQDIPLDSGVRVRVVGRPTRGVPLVARVIETRADTLVLDDGATTPLVLLAGDLERIEVERRSANREAAVTAGAFIGLVGGTAAAVKLCRGQGPDCWFIETDGNDDGDFDDDEDGILPSVGSLTIGAVALVGAGIGALLTPARWKRVGGAAAAPVRIGVRGARRGLGLMVSIPFGGPARHDGAARAAR
jgi:hypothetical protein